MRFYLLLLMLFFSMVAGSIYAQNSPQILLISLGNNLKVPNQTDRVKIDSVLKTLPKGDVTYYLGIKKSTGQYAFLSTVKVAQIYPPNAYDNLITKLKSLYNHLKVEMVEYHENLKLIEKN